MNNARQNAEIDQIDMQNSNIKGTNNIMADIARQLYARTQIGKAVIVTDQPTAAQRLLQRQWFRLIRKLQIQRALTDNGAIIADLSRTISLLQTMHFTTLAPFEAPHNDAFIMMPEGLHDILPECHTLFVAAPVPEALLEQVITCLPPNACVYKYVL